MEQPRAASKAEPEPDLFEQNGGSAASPLSSVVTEAGRGAPATPGYRFVAALKRTFSSLADRDYRLLWTGMVLQMAAMQVTQMANGFYIYELTGSASRLGVVAAASALPGLALTFYGGVLADRLEKKRLIQAGQLMFMLISLFIALSIATGTATWYHLLGASVVFGMTMPFLMPARMAIIPQVVAREKLMNAVALNSLGMSLTTMLAPAAAGGFIALVGVGGVYYVIAGMCVAAVLVTALLPRYPVESTGPKRSVLADMGGGIRYLRDNRVIVSLLAMGMLLVMLGMPLRFVLPIFAKDVFDVGPEGLGVMMSSLGAGSLVGAIFIASLGRIARRGLVLGGVGLLLGGAVLGFAVISHWLPLLPLAIASLALLGLVTSGQMAVHQSLTLEYVEGAYRGRVTSFLGLGFSLMPAAVLPLTVGMDALGPPLALGTMTVVLVLLAGGIFLWSPRLRALR